jgi:hypothetical protein
MLARGEFKKDLLENENPLYPPFSKGGRKRCFYLIHSIQEIA